MKTAQEMVAFIERHNLGRGISKAWDLKHCGVIEKMLDADEDIKFCFAGFKQADKKSKDESTGGCIIAVSNKRILLGQKKAIGQVSQTVLLDQLNDITTKRGLAKAYITIDTKKEKIQLLVKYNSADNINNALHTALMSVKSGKETPTAKPSGNAQDLREYKQLLDEGVITQAEFDKKKKEILG